MVPLVEALRFTRVLRALSKRFDADGEETRPAPTPPVGIPSPGSSAPPGPAARSRTHGSAGPLRGAAAAPTPRREGPRCTHATPNDRPGHP